MHRLFVPRKTTEEERGAAIQKLKAAQLTIAERRQQVETRIEKTTHDVVIQHKQGNKSSALLGARRRKYLLDRFETLEREYFSIQQQIDELELTGHEETVASAMSHSAKFLKRSQRDVNASKIEGIVSDLEGQLDRQEEVQKAMGKSFIVDPDISDEMLLDEIEAMVADDDASACATDSMPPVPLTPLPRKQHRKKNKQVDVSSDTSASELASMF